MIGESRVPHQHLFVFERRNFIAEHFNGSCGDDRPDRRANFFQRCPSGLRDGSQVIIDGISTCAFWICYLFRRRFGPCWRLFHLQMIIEVRQARRGINLVKVECRPACMPRLGVESRIISPRTYRQWNFRNRAPKESSPKKGCPAARHPAFVLEKQPTASRKPQHFCTSCLAHRCPS